MPEKDSQHEWPYRWGPETVSIIATEESAGEIIGTLNSVRKPYEVSKEAWDPETFEGKTIEKDISFLEIVEAVLKAVEGGVDA